MIYLYCKEEKMSDIIKYYDNTEVNIPRDNVKYFIKNKWKKEKIDEIFKYEEIENNRLKALAHI